jgi:endo-1,4-beta-xylanase
VSRRFIPLVSLAAAGALVLTGTPAAAADPPPTTVSAVDFEDGTTGSWTQSGGGADTLRVVDLDGGKVLQVTDRSADYVGLQSPAGIYEAGTTYTFSMRVRLADGTPDASARFVMKPAYTWVGNTAVTAAAWTTVTGEFTAPTGDAAALQAYIGTSDLPTAAPYTYFIDDITVTTASEPGGGVPDVPPGGAVDPTTTPVSAAQGTGDVAALTFDDGPNPATTPALLDFLAENDLRAVFCVIGQNITAPGGAEILRRIVADGHVLCNHSTTYDDMGALSQDQAAERMAENLTIIRTALDDPTYPVPFFRAPNGSWGSTPAAAVALGMQPLAVVNTIEDWATQDEAVLTANLRTAMKPGQLVLVHDGGGDRAASLAATRTVVTERLAEGWSFTLPVGTPDAGGEPDTQQPGDVLIDTTFDDGALDDWGARAGSGTSDPSVSVVAGGAGGTPFAAEVSERTHEGDGVQRDVAGVLLPGQTYRMSAAVRFAPGAAVGQGLTVSMRTVTGASESYVNLLQIADASAESWRTVEGEFTVPSYDADAEIYFEARYNSGNTSSFLVDSVRVWVPEPTGIDTSLVPLKDTLDFPTGVAIDSRETTGPASELLLHHFDQITPENHMKVEAWYDAEGRFARNAEATSLLDYAQRNDLRLYGHVLVWHSQTPAWFFQDGSGRELTSSAADQQLLRERLRQHIDAVAASIADDYGPYGSATNPVVGWDVVNEVVSDQATPDGLRTSRWHDVLGEEYIRLAFEYAEEAFNGTYAAEGAERPVKLFINDYNTEQDQKGAQYEALVKRLVQAEAPIDGVGHQFHVSVNTPLAAMQGALDRFAGMGLQQEVTELDVTINPATEANRIRQGHFYRDIFGMLRAYHADAPADEKLFAATVWGLTDTRSWRSEQQPLLFDGALQAKPAYYGAVDDARGLPPLVTTGNVFGGDVALTDDFVDAIEWRNLPENPLTGDVGGFQTRWSADHLTVLVRTNVAPERLEFTYAGEEYVYEPGAPGSVAGVSASVAGEHRVAVHLPHAGVVVGDTAEFDLRVVADGAVVGAWNSPGATGRLTFFEPLSFLRVPESAAPEIDAEVDAVWAEAATVTTATTVEGDAAGATAEVRTLWHGNTLYALFDVTDPEIDLSNSDPWNRDSVELFVDLGNTKAGSYGPNDTQIRITADNQLSFGSGNAAAQEARVQASATTLTGTGYRVEVALALIGQSGGQSDVPLGGTGTFHGIDFQVNDGRAGARTAVHTWAEPTGTGYQNTARWGVAELVPAGTDPTDPGNPTDPGDPTGPGDPGSPAGPGTPSVTPLPGASLTDDVRGGISAPATARPGDSIVITMDAARAGTAVEAWLYSAPTFLTDAVVSAGGSITARIPQDAAPGPHRLAVYEAATGTLIGWTEIRILPADGPLAVTGAALPLGALIIGLGLLAAGLVLSGRRRTRQG